MEHQRRIALIGDSILIEGVMRNLAKYPNLAIAHIDPSRCDVMEALQDQMPELVISEKGAPWEESLFVLLREAPALAVIGLTADSDRLTVLTAGSTRPRRCKTCCSLYRSKLLLTPGSGVIAPGQWRRSPCLSQFAESSFHSHHR